MRKFIIICLLFISITCQLEAQTTVDKENLMQSSQAGAMPVFFDVDARSVPMPNPGSKKFEGEYFIREGLPNFFSKAIRKDSLRIAFIGGSITRGDNMYRTQAAKYIHSLFPKAPMIGINAGVSGTGSDLGACRLHDQVLAYKPDLVFVEFAVNGAFAPGVEGIIRQIRKFDPTIDICLLYTISSGQAEQYAAGNMPTNIKGLEKIAEHYHVPSVHLGVSIGVMQQEGDLLWKGDPDAKNDKAVFSKDGLHPATAGGTLYAAAIARAFDAMKMAQGNNQQLRRYVLPDPLHPNNWEDAGMYNPGELATISTDWSDINPSKTTTINEFKPWFTSVLTANKPGASLAFKFRGTAFGIFDIGGPEVGQLLITIDGKSRESNRFNRHCNNRYRGQYTVFNVPDGEHNITIEIDKSFPDKKAILGDGQTGDIERHPEKYNQSVIYLGKILLKGKPLK